MIKNLLIRPLLQCVFILSNHSLALIGFPNKSSVLINSNKRPTFSRITRTRLFESSEERKEFDFNIITAASEKLPWEILEDKSSRPILNLSVREASPDEIKTTVKDMEDRKGWSQGQIWAKTWSGLVALGVEVDDDGENFLRKCSQLLRLDPHMVLESAEWIIDEFGVEYLTSEPKLLSFETDAIKYGLEFMSTMMMMDATPQCLASTDFYINAIELGIQEQSIKNALGAAGDATSKASQTIAGDAMNSLKKLKKQRKGRS